MTPIDGQAIVTAAQMRAAEGAAMADGTSVGALMFRAGEAVAAVVRRLASGNPVLVVCGPGNNGGDGYVAATALKRAGIAVRVAAAGDPASDAAKSVWSAWDGPVETLADALPAPVLVDALFGTGLSRPLQAIGAHLHRLADAASLRIAVDLPSGVATDDGRVLTPPPMFDVTLALGAAKPSHLLQPAARYMGAVRILDIGIPVASTMHALCRPVLSRPGPDAQKYTRGMVAVVAGTMAGAADMASEAAMRAGAGYVLLLGDTSGPPHALVRKAFADDALKDPRIGAIVVGPGLGGDAAARRMLGAALATDRPLVIDGDALRLVDLAILHARAAPAILTPHAGEFDGLFGKVDASKITRAQAAAARANGVVVFKGADTVIAAPDGRIRIAGNANDWLSTAGTGDVLAGTIGAMLASGQDPFEAAAAGVWLHGAAAKRLGAAFIADDLLRALGAVRASL